MFERIASTGSQNSIRGFTLIELMVALVLSLVLIGGLMLTYSSGRAASLEAERLSRQQENIRFASDFLIRDVRNAGFRDLLALTFEQDQTIGRSFAEYGNNDRTALIVRYAGRGACGRVFEADALKVIENRYFVADNGDLVCRGTEIDDEGEVTTIDPVTLASGLDSIQFEFIFPPGATAATVCDFYDDDDLDTACTGVEICMAFAGDPVQSVDLIAAFRNVIVDRVYGR